MFQITNVSSRRDIHPWGTINNYYGYLDGIIECEFNSFKLVMLDFKWYRLLLHGCDEDRIVIENSNRFLVIKTILFENKNDRYVFSSQCE